MTAVKLTVLLSGPEACSACKGACCKELPGECMPSDWFDANGEIDWDLVRRSLSTDEWCIDWWEGDPRFDKYEDRQVSIAPYIRPRHSYSRGVRDPSIFGGTCVFLTESGCRLPEERALSGVIRPAGCRNLVADLKITSGGSIHHRCYSAIGRQFKKEAAAAWLPYHEKLLELVSDIEWGE